MSLFKKVKNNLIPGALVVVTGVFTWLAAQASDPNQKAGFGASAGVVGVSLLGVLCYKRRKKHAAERPLFDTESQGGNFTPSSSTSTIPVEQRYGVTVTNS